MGKTFYKGFDKDLKCRGFQYEVGKEFETEDEVKCCKSGFHACENPFDVLDFYPILEEDGNENRFCEVEGGGDTDTDDKKTCFSKIKIKAEIGFKGLLSAFLEFVKESTTVEKTSGYGARIGSSGYGARIGSSGDGARIGSSGYGAQIGSSGDRARIGSSGDGAQIGSSGYGAQIGSSGYGAQIGSSGYGARIGSSGYGAQIGSSGYGARISSEGEDSVVCCAGHDCAAKAKKGSWITLSEWKFDENKKRYVPACVKTEFVDGERIKEDVYYKLVDGEFKEQDNA